MSGKYVVRDRLRLADSQEAMRLRVGGVGDIAIARQISLALARPLTVCDNSTKIKNKFSTLR